MVRLQMLAFLIALVICWPFVLLAQLFTKRLRHGIGEMEDHSVKFKLGTTITSRGIRCYWAVIDGKQFIVTWMPK